MAIRSSDVSPHSCSKRCVQLCSTAPLISVAYAHVYRPVQVSKPFFHSLSRWIYEGELQDPFKEFFVELNPDPANSGRSAIDTLDADQAALTEGDDGDAVSLWQSKFRFRADMLPSFVGDAFGRKVCHICIELRLG